VGANYSILHSSPTHTAEAAESVWEKNIKIKSLQSEKIDAPGFFFFYLFPFFVFFSFGRMMDRARAHDHRQ
jgi:hypothetical protein